ncbi:hypothetical protein CY652_08155 [Burkholderia sp. WAC0059]|nr:hypothetical protein CY652_08155 [Burkholderia sp. WAC0059]
MDITFDPAKDVTNVAKHGVSLSLAMEIDWPEVWCGVDDRKDYGELREIGYALISTRLFCVVFTQRSESFHVISLRKANPREVKRYAEHDQDPLRAHDCHADGRRGGGHPARDRRRP